MNDRELLELAAKAYGLPLGYGDGEYFYCEHGPFGPAMYGKRGYAPLQWNPLTDDGDALRLAVKLGIRIANMNGRACAFIGLRESWEPEVDDPYAATRRAIVRAAAEIGRAQP